MMWTLVVRKMRIQKYSDTIPVHLKAEYLINFTGIRFPESTVLLVADYYTNIYRNCIASVIVFLYSHTASYIVLNLSTCNKIQLWCTSSVLPSGREKLCSWTTSYHSRSIVTAFITSGRKPSRNQRNNFERLPRYHHVDCRVAAQPWTTNCNSFHDHLKASYITENRWTIWFVSRVLIVSILETIWSRLTEYAASLAGRLLHCLVQRNVWNYNILRKLF